MYSLPQNVTNDLDVTFCIEIRYKSTREYNKLCSATVYYRNLNHTKLNFNLNHTGPQILTTLRYSVCVFPSLAHVNVFFTQFRP